MLSKRSKMTMEVGQQTNVGRKRTHNEDYYGFFNFGPGDAMALVADGMGGHASGEVASKMAVEIIYEVYLEEARDKGIVEALKYAFKEANFTILQRSLEQDDLNGMGTTLTALVVEENQAYVGHMGDSRAYLLRDSTISQLTKDHTMVNRMLEQGLLSKEEAHRHPQRNVIYKTLGVNMDAELDLLGPIPVSVDDMFLLCSDGLTNHVADEEILEIANQNPPQKACEHLIDLANQRGGHDNITVQILKMKKSKHSSLSLRDRKGFLLIIGLILLILLALNGLYLIDPEFSKKIPFLSPNKF